MTIIDIPDIPQYFIAELPLSVSALLEFHERHFVIVGVVIGALLLP